MADSSYLRDKAGQALRLARDISDQVLVKSLIDAAAESLGRADAIDLERPKSHHTDGRIPMMTIGGSAIRQNERAAEAFSPLRPPGKK